MACEDYTLLQGGATESTWVSASSRVSTSYEAAEAFDGVCDGAGGTDNAWIDNNEGTSAWIMWTFPSPKTIQCWRFQIRELNGSYDSWPSAVTWRGMATGGTWGVNDTSLWTGNVPNYSSLSPGDWTDWTAMSSPGEYDLYRMEVDGVYNLNGVFDRSQIQEFEFYEEVTPLTLDDFGSTFYVNTPIVGNIGISDVGISFPFGGPYILTEPQIIAANLVMQAFGLQSYFGAHAAYTLRAFSFNSIIDKDINVVASMVLKGLSIEAVCGPGRFVNATFSMPGLKFTANISKDKLIVGALNLKALSMAAVAYELSTVTGSLSLKPLELKARGLQDLDYFVLRYVR